MSLGNLENLEEIDFSYNNLSILPNFVKMKRLRVLVASYNPLKNVPSCIGKMDSIKALDFEGCQLLPRKVAMNGNQQWAYYR